MQRSSGWGFSFKKKRQNVKLALKQSIGEMVVFRPSQDLAHTEVSAWGEHRHQKAKAEQVSGAHELGAPGTHFSLLHNGGFTIPTPGSKDVPQTVGRAGPSTEQSESTEGALEMLLLNGSGNGTKPPEFQGSALPCRADLKRPGSAWTFQDLTISSQQGRI